MGENSVKIHGIGGGYIKVHEDGGAGSQAGTALVEVWDGDKTASVRVCIDPRELEKERAATLDFARLEEKKARKWETVCRAAGRRLAEEIGSVDPADIEDLAERTVSSLRIARKRIRDLNHQLSAQNEDARALEEKREACGRSAGTNDLVRIAMERAAKNFDPDGNPDNDGIFSNAGFAVALARLSDAKDKTAASIALGAGLVRVILAGRPDVQVLQSHEHYALLGRELEDGGNP